MGKKDKSIKELEERVDRIEKELQAMRQEKINDLRAEADYYGLIASAYRNSGMMSGGR